MKKNEPAHSGTDSLNRVLYVDLARREFHGEDRPDLFSEYLGGAGVAIRLMEEECPPGCDPLSPENPAIFAVGPLTSFFPLASKTVAMFKSPLTGNLGESHCGGRSAVSIRLSGFGALVVRGRSDIPLYLAIHDGKVHFRNASTLWGMNSHFTAGRAMRERETGAGVRTIMRIGRAGENRVAYAGVTTETYRHFGRLGLGAVFGSKNLKGIVISGRKTLGLSDFKRYREVYDMLYESATRSPLMKKYHDLGTAENILPLNRLQGLPTRNLQKTTFDRAEEISGEKLAANHLGRRLACSHCPVACIHIAALREPYEQEDFFYKTVMIGYDYEPLYAAGSMLEIGDAPSVLRLIERMESLGLDIMSTGVVLAWATEASDKGLIGKDETMGISLTFGVLAGYLEACENIVRQPNEFYQALARGVEYASGKYGGREFALAFGGNEMPGYHTGPAAHLGYLAGARHSHLDSAGYAIDQKDLIEKKLPPEEIARKLVREEQWRQVLSSLVVCFFARNLYTPETVRQCLAALGVERDEQRLNRIGGEILRRKNLFKKQCGFSMENLRIPERIFTVPSPAGPIDEAFMRETLRHIDRMILNPGD